jgi:hypothetical protein
VSFAQPAQDIAFAEYRSAVRDAEERVARLDEALRSQLEHWRMRPVVEALRSLRGIDLICAVALVAEIGDFTRFARARELMGFLGLVPSEYTSGDTRRQGPITKTGNSHARRLLIEAAWNYRYPGRISRPLQRRQESQPKWVRDIAWRPKRASGGLTSRGSAAATGTLYAAIRYLLVAVTRGQASMSRHGLCSDVSGSRSRAGGTRETLAPTAWEHARDPKGPAADPSRAFAAPHGLINPLRIPEAVAR